MSQLVVTVRKIDLVQPHPGADRLELAVVGGWQTVIVKGAYKTGDIIVFIPPDSIVPVALSDRYKFTQYLSTGGRVKATRLRGEPSYGVIIPNEFGYPEGEDVGEKLGIRKWTPEIRLVGAKGGPGRDEEVPHPLFIKYTEIENLRHFNSIFVDGEEVVCTEKIHGTSWRGGCIDGELMAGSRRRRCKMPMKPKQLPLLKRWWYGVMQWGFGLELPSEQDYAAWEKSWVWSPLAIPNVEGMLQVLGSGYGQVILFGEVFGGNVQKGVRYGSPDKLDFRAFDLYINGEYLDYDEFKNLCTKYGVKTVPELYRGPYSLAKVKELSAGKTVVAEDTHIREGTVVRPVIERRDPKLGRVLLKYVSDDYLLSKDIGDFEDE